jgi:hypothetical protein
MHRSIGFAMKNCAGIRIGKWVLAAVALAALPAAAQPGATCGIIVTPDGTTQDWGPCQGQNNPAPSTPSVYGAIAISRSTMAYGTAEKFSTQQAANDFAVKDCAKKGAKDCSLFQAFANNLCAALALSVPDKAASIGLSGIMTFASSIATLRCQQAGGKSCVVAISFCADGVTRVSDPNSSGVFL